MVNKRFEVAKLKRELRMCGMSYVFKRSAVNQYNEPTNVLTEVVTIRGLYHEQNTRIEVKTGDTTQIRNKKEPMILCLFDDETNKIHIGDILMLGTRKMVVTGITDVQCWGLISDISLEVVDDGGNNQI